MASIPDLPELEQDTTFPVSGREGNTIALDATAQKLKEGSTSHETVFVMDHVQQNVNDDETGFTEWAEILNKTRMSRPRILGSASDRRTSLRPDETHIEKPTIRASIKRRIVDAPSRLRAKLRFLNEPRASAVSRADIDELMGLQDIELNRPNILKLTPTQLAPVLSAYMVSYDSGMVEEYCVIQTCLLKYLKDNLVNGAVLVNSEEIPLENEWRRWLKSSARTLAHLQRPSLIPRRYCYPRSWS